MIWFKIVVSALTAIFPWSLRRRLLNVFCGYTLHPSSYIGFSILAVGKLTMLENSRIGHLTIVRGGVVHMGKYSVIGNLNWISGILENSSYHFVHEKMRKSELVLGSHSSITNRHYMDFTNQIIIGEFATIAGVRSQFLTHSIDLVESRQCSSPIVIGKYCFVGTGCVLLGGAVLPDFSVLGAHSLLRTLFCDSYMLYAGVPAKPIKKLAPSAKYFVRKRGFVV